MRSYVRHLLEKDIKSAAWLDSLKREGISGESPR
jgi:hypothetical protein